MNVEVIEMHDRSMAEDGVVSLVRMAARDLSLQ